MLLLMIYENMRRVSKMQDEAVSKILTGTSENYTEAVLQDSSTSSSVVRSDSAGVSGGASGVYKDCVVNMYSSPAPPAAYPPYCSPGDRKIKGAARWLYPVYHRKYIYFPGSDVT